MTFEAPLRIPDAQERLAAIRKLKGKEGALFALPDAPLDALRADRPLRKPIAPVRSNRATPWEATPQEGALPRIAGPSSEGMPYAVADVALSTLRFDRPLGRGALL